MTVHHHLFATAIGRCGVAWSGRGLVALQLPDRDETATLRRLSGRAASASASAAEPPDAVASAIAGVRRYLDGERIDFSSVAVDLAEVDAFRRRLYETLRTIGYGRTTTYGELARTLGLSGWEGARDVGEAMGRNPVPIVIPCHRVLAAGGKPGGFSAPGGIATKRTLLALEGVPLGGEAPPRLPGF